MSCQGCGKITRLTFIDCEPSRPTVGWKRAHICMDCIERLDADMWIVEEHWKGINPIIPFEDLNFVN